MRQFGLPQASAVSTPLEAQPGRVVLRPRQRVWTSMAEEPAISTALKGALTAVGTTQTCRTRPAFVPHSSRERPGDVKKRRERSSNGIRW